MSEYNSSRHRWSWRSCFAMLKHNKRTKHDETYRSEREKLTGNGHIEKKKLTNIDENGNILCDVDQNRETDSQLDLSQRNQFQLFVKNDENQNLDDNDMQSTANHIQSVISNQKSLTSTGRPTQLDAIVEELNEENADESNEENLSIRLCSDREIIKDCTDLHSRLFDLSKMNHIIIQFNDRGYLYGEFTRQISKFKLKITDLERISNDVPRDAELLEAKYSTLLATIENLSLLVKITQITSLRSLICRLIVMIEQRMEQLNRLVQLTRNASTNLYEKRQDFNDDDFLSFRSAFSSYEHLLNITS